MNATNPNQTVGEALQIFYDANNFGEGGGVEEDYVWIKFGFFSVPIPNTQSRKNVVYMHDINHLVSGNDTSWRGESGVSAWEMGAGGWRNLYTPLLLTLWAMGVGVVFYPRHVFNSFQRGLTMNNALTCNISKEEIIQFTVAELKEKLSNQPKHHRNVYYWMAISFLVLIAPFIAGFGFVIGILQLF